jgi:hypothetical protein
MGLRDERIDKGLKSLMAEEMEKLFDKFKCTCRVYCLDIPLWSSKKEDALFLKIANNAGMFKKISFSREHLAFRLILQAQANAAVDEIEIILEKRGKVVYSRKKKIPELLMVARDTIEIDFPFEIVMEAK